RGVCFYQIPAETDIIYDAVQGTPHWNAEEIGFFTPNPAAETHRFNLSRECAGVSQLRAQVPLKTEAGVRANIQSCLREAAQEWYMIELSDLERKTLRIYPLEDDDGWFKELENWFKQRASSALKQLLSVSRG
ncbi:uncharacterized protein N7511_002755, partial [Penicillium nucicola]|uniref:uncharacterized protein n=1 Tax=Penicillium nucicola TaxID=1850975 RepID=UPI0025454DA8